MFFCFPDFIVGTVHKAKGLEFDTVIINDDFASVPASGHNLPFIREFSFCMFASFPLIYSTSSFLELTTDLLCLCVFP